MVTNGTARGAKGRTEEADCKGKGGDALFANRGANAVAGKGVDREAGRREEGGGNAEEGSTFAPEEVGLGLTGLAGMGTAAMVTPGTGAQPKTVGFLAQKAGTVV